ncbi:hypothetical protein BKA69DRAFT_1035060 [Paraphysoderma sedebokerense]|nr:hypothetical protein BKA69DRAFT_1035060 [Paraphysoderma sedebokerense]
MHDVLFIRPVEAPLNESVSGIVDEYSEHRPIIAVTAIQSQVHRLIFYSLQTHTAVKSFESDLGIGGIRSNPRIVSILYPSSITILSSHTLNEIIVLDDVLPSPFTSFPVVALSSQYIAYSTDIPEPEATHVDIERSAVKEATKRVAKEVYNGVKAIGDYSYQVVSNYFAPNQPYHHSRPMGYVNGDAPFDQDPFVAESIAKTEIADEVAGTVCIMVNFDRTERVSYILFKVVIRHVESLLDAAQAGGNLHSEYLPPPVAHFRQHEHPITALAFNLDGTLFVTASSQGQCFHVFEVLGQIRSSEGYALKHLYKLIRGFTNAVVESIAFDPSSQFVSVSTARGTVHVYAINNEGGEPVIMPYHLHSSSPKGLQINPIARLKIRSTQPNDPNLASSPEANSYSPPSLNSKHIRTTSNSSSASSTSTYIPISSSPVLAAFLPSASRLPSVVAASGYSTQPSWSEFLSQKVASGMNSKSTVVFAGNYTQGIYLFNQVTGVLHLNWLGIKSELLKSSDNSYSPSISVHEDEIADWKLRRKDHWTEYKMPQSPKKPNGSITSKSWISNIEVETHPLVPPIWTRPQFQFETFISSNPPSPISSDEDLSQSPEPSPAEDYFKKSGIRPTIKLQVHRYQPRPYSSTGIDVNNISESDIQNGISQAMSENLGKSMILEVPTGIVLSKVSVVHLS